MNTRLAEAVITYNGKAITTSLDRFFIGMTYTDPASGESDTLSVQLGDKDALWSNAWMPHMGDLLQAEIRVFDWARPDDNRDLACGKFTLDDLRYTGWPQSAEIGGVSAPVNCDFDCRERTKTWNKITIKKIANDIAYSAGLAFVYDAPEIKLETVEQQEQTNSAFLMGLCEKYGLSMKVFSQKLVIFDRVAYKKKDAVGLIRTEDMSAYDYRATMTGGYTRGEITYTDPKTEKEVAFSVGAGRRVLKTSAKAESRADAELLLNAALEKANHGLTTLKVSTMGNPSLVASQTVNVVGIGKLSGKYYIDKVVHGLNSNGYTCEYSLVLVEERGKVAVQDAIQRLTAVGVINTPDYWVAHYGDVQYLDELLLNLSARIQERREGGGITEVQAALLVLVDAGVINSPDYWQQNIKAIAYLDNLVIQAANAIRGAMA
ncbi:phage late control D family protein [Intestinibacillus massiliensis]|uniref:phage late control D family protein n=1 Tax=Intestinibacillus massiliensis TaxID=1871029 RepID=UPI000B35F653|nr:hypothetical protein [Intestinibacillus massiliensis]